MDTSSEISAKVREAIGGAQVCRVCGGGEPSRLLSPPPFQSAVLVRGFFPFFLCSREPSALSGQGPAACFALVCNRLGGQWIAGGGAGARARKSRACLNLLSTVALMLLRASRRACCYGWVLVYIILEKPFLAKKVARVDKRRKTSELPLGVFRRCFAFLLDFYCQGKLTGGSERDRHTDRNKNPAGGKDRPWQTVVIRPD